MTIVHDYFDAFAKGDVKAMADCLSEDVAHYVNEGNTRVGKEMFMAFCQHMNTCYQEKLTDMVVFVSDDQKRAAAEYVVNGTYLETDEGLPEAVGQTYKLPAGSFFDIKDGKIARVTTYYNLSDWMAQVS